MEVPMNYTPKNIGLGVLGAMSVWPLVYVPLFICVMFFGGEWLFESFHYVIAVHGMTTLLGLALTVGYAVHALRDERLPMEQRLLWAVILFVGNLLAAPVYFYVRILKAPAPRFAEN